jgi:acyl-CoA reductase-like NAD-dependent aldehyde dehydrogenase
MVPLWTIPIALAAGNCVILKPSEKVPVTMSIMADLFKQAGIPDGAFNIVNGTKEAVTAICTHKGIEAVTFVGSSPVAHYVASTCQQAGKRVLAMGGAKNHLIALPDCEREATATDVVSSFTGCGGQRCMAASVLVIVEDQTSEFGDDLIRRIVEKSSKIQLGQGTNQMGPLIDPAAVDRVSRATEDAQKRGMKVLVDGRTWVGSPATGYWLGPTVIEHPKGTTHEDPCLRDEIFGPFISIVRVSSRSEALAFENESGFGNAACIYTSSGDHADWFSKRFTSAMIGVNIGVPVPREPFSFGGMGASKFGCHGDVTGDNAIEFFTRRRKITTRWPIAGNSENLPWFK